jgi:predicted nucleic acid-binding protein
MGKRYLIDTNAIQDYLQESYPEKGLIKMDKILSLEANISIISKIEILSYTPDDETFNTKLQAFVAACNLYYLDEDVIENTIRLRKDYRMKIGDAIIAATAQLYDFTVITNNERDFNRVIGLKILNPFKI